MAYENIYSSDTAQAPEAVRDRLENVKRRTSELAQRAKARGSEALEDTNDLIRQNPIATVGICLIAGVALGALAVKAFAPSNEYSFDKNADRAADAYKRVKESVNDLFNIVKDKVTDTVDSFR